MRAHRSVIAALAASSIVPAFAAAKPPTRTLSLSGARAITRRFFINPNRGEFGIVPGTLKCYRQTRSYVACDADVLVADTWFVEHVPLIDGGRTGVNIVRTTRGAAMCEQYADYVWTRCP